MSDSLISGSTCEEYALTEPMTVFTNENKRCIEKAISGRSLLPLPEQINKKIPYNCWRSLLMTEAETRVVYRDVKCIALNVNWVSANEKLVMAVTSLFFF